METHDESAMDGSSNMQMVENRTPGCFMFSRMDWVDKGRLTGIEF